MPNDMPVRGEYLRINDIAKSFGIYDVLKKINLEVKEQEFVCLLGPSGCGKSTLLRIIAGLEDSSGGALLRSGQAIERLRPAERRFGIVFQSYALFPNLNVEQNVGYGLRGSNWTSEMRGKRVSELLDLIGLPSIARKYPAQLSGGQQQRVALARALAPSPELLLLDEPLSALDAQIRSRLRIELKNLQKLLGIATIMVTHDQEEALTMADRIAVMNEGSIEQYGTPQELYNNPGTLFVAQFIGSMNTMAAIAHPDRTIDLGGGHAGSLPSNVARGPIKVCIRPEFVTINAAVEPGSLAFDAEVATTEFLGTTVRVHLSCPRLGTEFIMADLHVGAGIDIRAGQKARVGFPLAHIHVYGGKAQ